VAWVHRIKHAALAAMIVAGLSLAAVPAAAQMFTDGFKFLEAVEKKDRRTVIELVNKNKTIIDSRDLSKGHTALHLAVQRRDLPWVDYLLGLNANANIADKQGVTPLTLAAQIGFVEAVSLLSSRGARVDVPNNAGETPLMAAVHRRDMALLRVLLRAGADPDRKDNSGRSARDYAALDGPNNAIANEIKRLADASKKEKPAQVYGPSF
jgi:ankyrin repeat protein